VIKILELTIDLHELQNVDDVQKEIVVNWNQKKLNTLLKGEFVGRDRAFAREVDEIELCVFNNKASLILLYKQDDFYKSLYKKLYKGRSFLKIDFDIVSEIVIFEWHTREWTIEKQKLV
jgi:hypothetical protein